MSTKLCSGPAGAAYRSVTLPQLDSEELELPYRRVDKEFAQARLKGRFAIEPDVDLSGISVRSNAVVDFVTFEVRMGRVTQWKYIQDVMRDHCSGPVKVVGPNDESAHTGQAFKVTAYDAKGTELRAALEAVEAEFGLEGQQNVRALEVSVDFYPKDQSEDSRRQLVGVLQRHFRPLEEYVSGALEVGRFVFRRNGRTRIWSLLHDKGEPYIRVEEESLEKVTERMPPYLDSTVYVGEKDGPVSWRIMDKVTDRRRGAGEAKELPQNRRRARIEVTLRGEALRELGIETLDDLKGYQFSKLRKRYFDFELPTFEMEEGERGNLIQQKADQMRWDAFDRAGVYGLAARDSDRIGQAEAAREHGLPKQPSSIVSSCSRRDEWRRSTHVAYTELNKRVTEALRGIRF